MARHRKTDPQEALMRAMALFYEHGYEAVGTRQIEEQAGITRFTLQTVYGGKMALYEQTLDLYLTLSEGTVAPPAQVDTVDQLADWFLSRLSPPEDLKGMARGGCFFLNAMVEFGACNPVVTARRARYRAMIGGRFVSALEGLKQAGLLPAGFDVAPHAEILNACTLSMNIDIRAAHDNAAARPIAEACAALVRGWGRREPVSG